MKVESSREGRHEWFGGGGGKLEKSVVAVKPINGKKGAAFGLDLSGGPLICKTA